MFDDSPPAAAYAELLRTHNTACLHYKFQKGRPTCTIRLSGSVTEGLNKIITYYLNHTDHFAVLIVGYSKHLATSIS